MPVSIDARPPGLNLTFLRGTARNQPILFPAGTLAGRTFTATLDGVGLSVGIVGDTLTVSVTVAQTNAAANGPLPFVLTETTGVDQPYVIGTWRASTRPSAVTPSSPFTLVVNNETVTLQPISGTEFPELVAGDPAELGLVTGGVTTISLLDTIARTGYKNRSGHYYMNAQDSVSATGLAVVNRVYYLPVFLSAGTIDRIGCEVTTAQTSATIRMGVYTDDNTLPLNRIAEATSGADTYPLDASTTGVKNAAISATIPVNGLYWLAIVNQGSASAVSLQGYTRNTFAGPISLGTATPAASSGSLKSMSQASVTGALPATTTIDTARTGAGIFIHYRYV